MFTPKKVETEKRVNTGPLTLKKSTHDSLKILAEHNDIPIVKLIEQMVEYVLDGN